MYVYIYTYMYLSLYMYNRVMLLVMSISQEWDKWQKHQVVDWRNCNI